MPQLRNTQTNDIVTVDDQIATWLLSRGSWELYSGAVTPPSFDVAKINRIVARDEDIESWGASTANSDNITFIQNAQNAAAAGGHQLHIPSSKGFYRISDTLYLDDKVVCYGDGRDDGGLRATTTFPTDGRPLIRLGRAGSGTLMFGTRVKEMRLHGESRAHTIVYSTTANEQSGVFNCHIAGYTHTGIHFLNGSCISVEDLELSGSIAGVLYGIHFEECANDNLVKRVTWGPGAAQHAVGLRCWHSQTVGIALHPEQCVVGIDFDDSSGILFGVSGPNTNPTVTTLIRTQNAQECAVFSANKGVATNTIVDVVSGETITTDVKAWFAGGLRIKAGARPTVTGSKGANAALTSLMTALGPSGLGLVTDSTT